MKSNRTPGGGYGGINVNTVNSTIDISTLTNNAYNGPYGSGVGAIGLGVTTINSKLSDLPKIKEVWRWVKNLLSSYISLRKTLPSDGS